MRPIALLTDFGTQDIYVGVMKGVMRSICPDVQFMDLTHGINPQSVREGAIALRNAYRYFAAGTIFLCVVDPGVGSKRRPIVVKAGGYYFVAPDNGLLTYTLAAIGGSPQVVALENPRYRLPEISSTFHGRDVFAPAAAYLARGVEMTQFGSEIRDMTKLPLPQLTIEAQRITGEVTYIDHYGNLLTSIGILRRADDEFLTLEPLGQPFTPRILAEQAQIRVHSETLYGIHKAYYEVERGAALAQVDSHGYLEIAVNQGNAAAKFGATIGDTVEVLIHNNRET
jgi:hypothetical protein